VEWKLPPLGGDGDVDGCSMTSCAGVDLRAAILEDLRPWAARGGISRADVDHAASLKVLQNPYTKLNAKGWLRVTVSGGALFASHVGHGQGSRDGVLLLALLELLERFPGAVPDVDLVVYTEDRARLERARFSAGAAEKGPPLPFAVSFARHADYLDVAVPDPSFFGWPEMSVNPHWQLRGAPVARTPWADRAPKVGPPPRTLQALCGPWDPFSPPPFSLPRWPCGACVCVCVCVCVCLCVCLCVCVWAREGDKEKVRAREQQRK